MKKSIIQKLLILATCTVLVLSLSACGNADDTNKEDNESQGTASQEETAGADSASQDAVTVDNVSLKPIKLCSNNPDEESTGEDEDGDTSPYNGVAIEATINNTTDDSVDVTLAIEATVKYKDDYDDEQTVHAQLGGCSPGFNCPYSAYDEYENLPPVGLAPQEKKTVRYYYSNDNHMIVYDLDNNYNEISMADATISNIKLMDVTYEKSSKYIYLPASEWIDNVKFERKEGREFGVDYLGEDLTSKIINNTNDRWESAGIKLDVKIEDQWVNWPFENESTYIGIGKRLPLEDEELAHQTIITDLMYDPEKGGHKAEIVSGILYYVPENADGADASDSADSTDSE